jgi:arylsulfatase A-like enzyme
MLGVLAIFGCAQDDPSSLAMPGADAPVAALAKMDQRSVPNIVVILADDLGYADISTYGGRIPTPNIDRIGAEGAVFNQGYVTTPVCSPSRAALMTGRYQQRFGFEYNARQADDVPDVGLLASERTIADDLQSAGYVTGLVGKWHLGFNDEHYPTNRGFDEFFGHLAGASNFINVNQQGAVSLPRQNALRQRTPGDNRSDVVVRGSEPPSPPRRPRGNQIVRGPDKEPVPVSGYLTDVFAEEAVRFIDGHAQEPLFLYAAFNAPHSPFQTTREYYDRFPDVENELQRIYFGMVAALDDAVGDILAALDRNGLTENTLVLFLSDNGCAGYFQGLCSCEPLSGGKLTYYEGGVRVPFLMRWPAAIEAGTTIETPVSSLDVLPTALAAVGQKAPTRTDLDGFSLLGLAQGSETTLPRENLVWRNYPTVAARSGNMKLIKPHQDRPGGFLYDLAVDPREQKDLAAARPAQVASLESDIDAWQAITVEPGWSRRPAVTYSICNIEPIGFEN